MPRLIYSLLFELADDGDRCPRVELVVPLTPDGQSPYIRAELPKLRVIDLRAGDWCRHKALGRRRLATIRAYRDAWFAAAEKPDLRAGYFLPRAGDVGVSRSHGP